ncbi:MAG: hypothetical protein H6737_12250 [Alphaproteobacteria bacterium]|nr:hypothetical protein [Alphaproteobacteria bacterium]
MLLWVLTGLGLAAEGPCSPDIVEFRHEVELRSSNDGTIAESYRFTVPAKSCKAVQLPRLLDGFKLLDQEIVVENGVLPRDKDWKRGQVLIVTGTRELQGGPFSEEVPLPPFPVLRTVVEVTAPSYTRLTVWADPTAQVEVRRDRVRRYRATFAGGGRVVWSTEKDWWDVGTRLESAVSRKLATKAQLGDLAEGIEYLTPADAMRKLAASVKLDAVGPAILEAASAPEVLERGHGSAAERGLVLLSLLRAAGYEADIALVRPFGTQEVSLAVPGVGLFNSVAIRLLDEKGREVWLDPRSPYNQVEEMPLGMRGSVALVPGDYPRRVHDRLAPDGRVTIKAKATVKEDGSLEVLADVVGEGGGPQAIRDVLAPLSKDFRKQWLSDLLGLARPNIDKLRFQVFGVEDPAQPLGMSLEFLETKALEPIGENGLRGTVPAILAPHLARVLPPNIEVIETIELKGTGELRPFGVQPVEVVKDRDAVLHRQAVVKGNTATLTTSILRPWRVLDREENTDQYLFRAAEAGPQLLMFDTLDRSITHKLRAAANNTETRVLEALLWYEAGDEDEAERTLRGTLRTARVRSLLEILSLYTPRGEFRPFDVVWDNAADDHDRLAIVQALEKKRERREAWRRASMLVNSELDAVRIEAVVTVARIQGERPAASVDEEAHKAWREPALLVKRATKWAEEAYGERGHPAVDIPAAEQLILDGRCAAAGPLIERASEVTDVPHLRAIRAEWQACLGNESVESELESIIVDSDYDPVVITSVVRAFWKLGRIPEARRWSFLGALIAKKDAELWMTASDAALEAGDLPSAVYCARQASDLEPTSVRFTVPLQILATLAGDAEVAKLATKRTGYAVSIQELPVTMDNAEEFITEEQRLGFLRLRDADVLEDPALLEERARRQLALKDEVGTIRDAAWLARKHHLNSADGTTYLAMAEEIWSTMTEDVLSRSVKDDSVRKLRMEYALLTGSVDPSSDARLLQDDPAAEIIRIARSDVAALASKTEWPEGLVDPDIRAPEGFRPSNVLGALDGVVGFTNQDAGASVLASADKDRLPPPVAGVYTLGPVVGQAGRVTIHALEGGAAPAYCAVRQVGETTWWGISRSRQLAVYAVQAGIAAQSVL